MLEHIIDMVYISGVASVTYKIVQNAIFHVPDGLDHVESLFSLFRSNGLRFQDLSRMQSTMVIPRIYYLEKPIQ